MPENPPIIPIEKNAEEVGGNTTENGDGATNQTNNIEDLTQRTGTPLTEENQGDETKQVHFVGLINQGTTCYLNCLLQSLYNTPEFRDMVWHWKTDQLTSKSIPFELQRLFVTLKASDRNAVDTNELTRSFGWTTDEVFQQHDVQELWRLMFDALESSFKNTNVVERLKYLYEGELIDYVKCLTCQTINSKSDLFQDIALPIKPFGRDKAYSSVEEALDAFIEPETLNGSNQYQCDVCKAKSDAHKGLAVVKLPYIFTIQLKRFDFDVTTFARMKLNDRVTFPELLDLKSFMDKNKAITLRDKLKTKVEIKTETKENGKEPSEEKSDKSEKSDNTEKPAEEKKPVPKTRIVRKKIVPKKTTDDPNNSKQTVKIPKKVDSHDGAIKKTKLDTADEVNKPRSPKAKQETKEKSVLPETFTKPPVEVKTETAAEEKTETAAEVKTETTAEVKMETATEVKMETAAEVKMETAAEVAPPVLSPTAVTSSDIETPPCAPKRTKPKLAIKNTGVMNDNNNNTNGDYFTSLEPLKSSEDDENYVYELFSVLLHSGSASGGHYFAYIKSLETGQWRCFDDRTVTDITTEQLEEAYGGSMIKGSCVRSTNGYYLMYRKVDPQTNVTLVESSKLPDFIMEKISDYLLTDKRVLSSTFDISEMMLKLRVWYQPTDGILPAGCKNRASYTDELPRCIVRLYLASNATIAEVISETLKQLNLDNIRRDQCRLIKYSEILQQKEFVINGNDNDSMSEILKDAYDSTLLIEVRKDGDHFEEFDDNQIVFAQIYHLDYEGFKVEKDTYIQCSINDTVNSLKYRAAEKLQLPTENLKIVCDKFNCMPTLLENGEAALCDLKCNSCDRFYVATVPADKCLKDNWYQLSAMNKLVMRLKGITRITVVLPLLPEEKSNGEVENCLFLESADSNKENIEETSKDANTENENSLVQGDDKYIFSYTEIEIRENKRIGKIDVETCAPVSWLRDKMAHLVGAESRDDISLYYYLPNRTAVEIEVVAVSQTIEYYFRLGQPRNYNPQIELKVLLQNQCDEEINGKAYLLDLQDESNPFKYFISTIIKEKWSIRKIKKLTIEKLVSQYNLDLPLDKCRLRKKFRKYATTVLSDCDTLEDYILGKATWEYCVQVVDDGDKLYSTVIGGKFIFVKCFMPKKQALRPMKEIYLPNGSSEEFLDRACAYSGIPEEFLTVLLGATPFPCDADIDKLNSQTGWFPIVNRLVPWWETKIFGDGHVVFLRDSREYAEVAPTLAKTESSNKNELRITVSLPLSNGTTEQITKNGSCSTPETKLNALINNNDDSVTNSQNSISNGTTNGDASNEIKSNDELSSDLKAPGIDENNKLKDNKIIKKTKKEVTKDEIDQKPDVKDNIVVVDSKS